MIPGIVEHTGFRQQVRIYFKTIFMRFLTVSLLSVDRATDTMIPYGEHFHGRLFWEQFTGGAMKVVGKEILDEFKKGHANARSQVDAWVAEAEHADWKTPNDIRERFSSASFLAGNRVVFNIKGNTYRLDVKVAYQVQVVRIKRIGTHAEYAKWEF